MEFKNQQYLKTLLAIGISESVGFKFNIKITLGSEVKPAFVLRWYKTFVELVALILNFFLDQCQ